MQLGKTFKQYAVVLAIEMAIFALLATLNIMGLEACDDGRTIGNSALVYSICLGGSLLVICHRTCGGKRLMTAIAVIFGTTAVLGANSELLYMLGTEIPLVISALAVANIIVFIRLFTR